MHPFSSALLALTVVTLPFSSIQAQEGPRLIFSGGNGSPLHVTLDAPVRYRVTAEEPTSYGIVFGNLRIAHFSTVNLSGSATIQLNGGPLMTQLTISPSPYDYGDMKIGDLLIFLSDIGAPLVVGDEILFTAMSFSTSESFSTPSPSSGDYESFVITFADGTRIADGIPLQPVPEPGFWAFTFLGVAALWRGIRKGRTRTRA